MKQSVKVSLTAVLIKDEVAGGFTSYLSELPEVVAEGETQDDAVSNLMAALSSVLEWKREEASRDMDASYTTQPLELELA